MTLREFRNQRGINRLVMAEILGCSEKHIQRIEQGKTVPTAKYVDRFRLIYGNTEVREMAENYKDRVENESLTDDAFVQLAFEIVKQAVDDYRRIKGKPTYIRTKEERTELKELKEFFRGEWFEVLCGKVNPDVIRKAIGIK